MKKYFVSYAFGRLFGCCELTTEKWDLMKIRDLVAKECNYDKEEVVILYYKEIK